MEMRFSNFEKTVLRFENVAHRSGSLVDYGFKFENRIGSSAEAASSSGARGM